MADSSGVAYRDLVPIPDKDTIDNPSKHETAQTLDEGPTASHALATSPTEETGLVQLDHDEEVKDLGWNEPKEAIPAPLVGGMENEDLWVLVRRFDKVCYCLPRCDTHGLLADPLSSKCTMSRSSLILFPTTSTSTLLTRMSSRRTSCAQVSSGST